MSQIKTVQNIINRLNEAEKITGMVNKADEMLHSNTNRKKNEHVHNAQELWGMIKRLNLRI